MELVHIRIRNYKTLGADAGYDFAVKSGLTLVGPNNSGKTNLLEAVRLFFTGYNNVFGYERSRDLPFGSGNSQTSVACTFLLNESESQPRTILSEIYDLLESPTIERDFGRVTVYLIITTGGNPSYRLFPNEKKPRNGSPAATYSKKVRDFVTWILEKTVVHYLPSYKSTRELYHDLLLPSIRRHVANQIQSAASEIRNALKAISNDVNQSLEQIELPELEVDFSIPDESIEKLLSGFDFFLRDDNRTSVFHKGMGVQSAAIMTALCWLTQHERGNGKYVVWLIEEPESYLHPRLFHNVRKIIDLLAESAAVVVSTHSLSFVPQRPSMVLGTEKNDGMTTIRTFVKYADATASIRQSIGMRFSDFYNFDLYNVLVEGQTDRDYIEWVTSLLKADGFLTSDRFPILSGPDWSVLDFGGARGLGGFLRATWQLIVPDTMCVAVFDGDNAGKRETRDLQQYFGNKNVPFQANRHFVSVRKDMPIEGLFPDKWIIEIQQEHPGWFEYFSVDASGTLEQMKIRDKNKTSYRNHIKEKVESESNSAWTSRWRDLFMAIESSLSRPTGT